VVDERAQDPERVQRPERAQDPEPGQRPERAQDPEPGQRPERAQDPEPAQPSDRVAPGSDPGAPPDDGSASATRIRLRRAPRYRAFVGTGTLLGLVAAALLVIARPVHEGSTPRTVFVYFALGLSLIGALVGAAAAILLERRPRRP
jgi:hypothetical protein